MAQLSSDMLEGGLAALIKKKRSLLKVGGVVSLGSYLSATKPDIYKKIKGDLAFVEVKKVDGETMYLYFKLPLYDNEYEELRIIDHSDFEEGDEVWISSIIVLFIENSKGETIVRYDGRYLDEKPAWKREDLKSDVFNKCLDLLLDSWGKGPTINLSYNCGKCPAMSFGVINGDGSVYLKIHDSASFRVIKLDKYKNARPLTHGLILAGNSIGHYDVLNADGTMFCKNVHRVDYGEDYLNCADRLWLYNKENNQWEEKHFGEFHIVFGTVGEGMVGVYKKMDLHNGRRIYKKNAKKYFFLDWFGGIKLEIENEWEINSGFHNGTASISHVNSFYNDYYWRKIDVEGNIIDEDSYHQPDYSSEDDNEKDNWYAMTDGMYGDYPEEGFDGDYESIGY